MGWPFVRLYGPSPFGACGILRGCAKPWHRHSRWVLVANLASRAAAIRAHIPCWLEWRGSPYICHGAAAVASSTMPSRTSSPPRELFIQGITQDGKTFRPSDWAERLAGVMCRFQPGGNRPGAHLGYSPWCTPTTVSGVKCVVIHSDLQDYDPMAWDFVLNFARDNRLQVVEACLLRQDDDSGAASAATRSAGSPSSIPSASVDRPAQSSPEAMKPAISTAATTISDTAAATAATAVDAGLAAATGAQEATAAASATIRVGVVMGSGSDWDTMQHAVAVLEEFGIAHEARVVSAHRMPDDMFAYAEAAAARGLYAIIAGAGGAAHLPGMLAAKTTVPVLGVPVASRHLQGVDSLHSIVQMPKGVPVATFAIGAAGAANAALFAVALLANTDPALRRKLEQFRAAQTAAARSTTLPPQTGH